MEIDYQLLKKSINEVFWLSLIAFFPSIISITIYAIKLNDISDAIKIIHPAEYLAFCLSFLAPSLFFLKKSHGKSYQLPFLDFFFFSTFFMYIIALLLSYLIKNNIDPDLTNSINNKRLYLIGSAIFLFVTMVFRTFSTYHTSKSSDFITNKKAEETDFNQNFKSLINGN